jgi:hypothetical protein
MDRHDSRPSSHGFLKHEEHEEHEGVPQIPYVEKAPGKGA